MYLLATIVLFVGVNQLNLITCNPTIGKLANAPQYTNTDTQTCSKSKSNIEECPIIFCSKFSERDKAKSCKNISKYLDEYTPVTWINEFAGVCISKEITSQDCVGVLSKLNSLKYTFRDFVTYCVDDNNYKEACWNGHLNTIKINVLKDLMSLDSLDAASCLPDLKNDPNSKATLNQWLLLANIKKKNNLSNTNRCGCKRVTLLNKLFRFYCWNYIPDQVEIPNTYDEEENPINWNHDFNRVPDINNFFIQACFNNQFPILTELEDVELKFEIDELIKARNSIQIKPKSSGSAQPKAACTIDDLRTKINLIENRYNKVTKYKGISPSINENKDYLQRRKTTP